MFFPDGPGGHIPAAYAKAKAVCAGCAVRVRCGEDALARREPDGVWGGMDPNDRALLLDMRDRRPTTRVHGLQAARFLAEVA